MISGNIKKFQDCKNDLLSKSTKDQMIQEYLLQVENKLTDFDDHNLISFLLSEENYKIRKDFYGSSDTGVIINDGDIVFCDFGNAYKLEVGNQHLAIVMKIIKNKIFVIPITSSEKAWKNANRDLNLMRLRKSKYLLKQSTLYLNDCKFINSSRVIDVRGKISNNELIKIKERIQDLII